MTDQFVEISKAALINQLVVLHQALIDLVDPVSEPDLWKKPVVEGNSIAHLILHLTGNLNFFVGTHLAGTGFVRDREREFTEPTHMPREILLANLEEAVALFKSVVRGLSEEQLLEPHPEARFGNVLQTLIHLVIHFAIHRGQISYLARFLRS